MEHEMSFSEKIQLLLDGQFGVIKYIDQRLAFPGSPGFFHMFSTAANTKIFAGCENAQINGGASTSRDIAIAKAVGEAVERYCSTIYKKEHLPFSSYRDANFTCVPPDKFALYTTEQCNSEKFAFKPFTEDTPVHWVKGYNLLHKEDTHVPASLVYVPYHFEDHEVAINQPISTGLSCHGDVYSAGISSLSEVIERDALMITWQAMIAPPKIDQSTLPEDIQLMLAQFTLPHEKVILLDVTTDCRVPTIMAFIRDDSGTGPPIVIATATDPSPKAAIRKVLEELAHTRYYIRLIYHHLDRLDPSFDYNKILNERHHMNFWCDPVNLPRIDFIFSNPRTVTFQELADCADTDHKTSLLNMVNAVKSTGHDSIFVDLTTRDIKDAGLKVIRVVVPGYHPLAMGYRYRVLGGTRLWTVPQKLGYPGITRYKDNPVPHPFP